MSPDVIGWLASTILVVTLAKQIHKQATSEHVEGVSHWLFAGQIAASVGFIAYSWLLENWVFITTNSVILLTALTGQWVVWRKQSKTHTSQDVRSPSRPD